MNNTRRTYLLTLNSPSQRALRLWTGENIHALRHCSVKEIGNALVEMQNTLDHLQQSMRALQHVTQQLVSSSADEVAGNLKQDHESSDADHRSNGQKTGNVFRAMNERTLSRQNSRGPFFRNIRQKGDPHGGKGRGRSRT